MRAALDHEIVDQAPVTSDGLSPTPGVNRREIVRANFRHEFQDQSAKLFELNDRRYSPSPDDSTTDNHYVNHRTRS
jgi:hypothetical protein